MKKKLITAVMLLIGTIMPYIAMAQEKTPAFPGAEGFGMYTTGGRGGTVYHVTTLEDNNTAGSFRHACSQSKVRTIVFDVSGTIHLKSELKLSRGNVTIAGQTAPGDGICIADYPFVIAADNVIIRFIRFRLGNEALKTNSNAHEGDGLGGMDRSNIIIDHCSVSWSIDECLSVYGSKNLTVQWCIASQSLRTSGHAKGNHGYGGNWGGSGATYHHNLMAHHDSRVPRLGPRQSTQKDERMDLRNNVFYNWSGNGCYGGEGMNVNIVNNYYKPGPATRKKSSTIQQRIAKVDVRTVDYCLDKKTTLGRYNSAAGASAVEKDVKGSCSGGKNYVSFDNNKIKFEINMTNNTINVNGKTVTVAWNGWKPMLHTWGKFYVEGNYNPAFSNLNSDNFKYGVSNQIDNAGNDGTYPGDSEVKITTPITYENITTHSAEDAYERVLAYAGASLHRDWVDDLMVSDTRKNVATYTGSNNSPGIINSQDDNKPANAGTDWSAWPVLNSEAAPADTDGDGIPDAWENANGLDKNNAADGAVKGDDGYTNLERYMNSLVEHIMEGGNEGGTLLSGQQIYGETNGISDITAEKRNDNKIYNLQGMEVQNPIKGGIYIRNGKKFIVRK